MFNCVQTFYLILITIDQQLMRKNDVFYYTKHFVILLYYNLLVYSYNNILIIKN